MAGRVAPKDRRNNIQDLCPKERSPRNSKDPVQDPQAPKPLVEDPGLKDKDHLHGEWRELFKIYIERDLQTFVTH